MHRPRSNGSHRGKEGQDRQGSGQEGAPINAGALQAAAGPLNISRRPEAAPVPAPCASAQWRIVHCTSQLPDPSREGRACAAAAAAANQLLLLMGPVPSFPAPQEFLAVFERLRDEIVNDELLAGQPEASKKWIKEVRRWAASAGTVGWAAVAHAQNFHFIMKWPPERNSLLLTLQMMDYNVPLGKLNRGMAVLDVVRSAGGCCWAMVLKPLLPKPCYMLPLPAEQLFVIPAVSRVVVCLQWLRAEVHCRAPLVQLIHP